MTIRHNETLRSPLCPRPFVLLLELILLVSLLGCSQDPGQVIPNREPFVRFTSGPTQLEQNRSFYSIRAEWTGWDFDGEIDHYEYTLDANPDPLNPIFTLNEINYPEQYLGKPLRVHRGSKANTDTLVFGKTVDGIQHTFRWIQTTEYSRSFDLLTPTANGDTATVGRTDQFEYLGHHTLFVRVFDDDGAVSQMDYLSADISNPESGFVVVNIVPESTITSPVSTSGQVIGSSIFTVRWEGTDPDSPNVTNKVPESYLWKLISVPDEWQIGFFDINFVMYRHEDFKDIPWNRVGGDSTQVTLFLEKSKRYLFSLRAVDVAGGKEAHLSFSRGSERGGNSLLVQVNNFGRPELEAFEPTLGTITSRGSSRAPEHEIPVGTCLRFSWTADASGYGGDVQAVAYGLDIQDLDDHSPGSNWSSWIEYDEIWVEEHGAYQALNPICINQTGEHIFYLKAKDQSGIFTVISYKFHVVAFTLERPILYIDDWSNFASKASDLVHETYWLDVLVNSGRYLDAMLTPATTQFDTWGPNDKERFATPLPLGIMAKHRLLFWETGSGAFFESGFSLSATYTGYVDSFLRHRGQLLYFGERTVAHAIGGRSGQQAFGYPFNLSGRITKPFAYTYLSLFTSQIGNSARIPGAEFRARQEALYYLEPRPSASDLPRLRLDPHKTSNGSGTTTGLVWDYLIDPISEPAWFTGHIDSLYQGHTIGKHVSDQSTSVDGRFTGLRISYDPDDPNPKAQGRVVWLGFPLYFFMDDEIQDTVNSLLDWFLEESRNLESAP